MSYMTKGKYERVLSAYEAKPEGEAPYPTIILFMHAYGLDSAMLKVCDDLAEAGYLCIAADAYLNGQYGFKTKTDETIFHAFDVLLDWLAPRSDIDHDRLGLIGFCMGGRHAYLANARYDIFKAVVPYYGFPHRGNPENDPDSKPQNLISQFTGATLSIFGAKDRGIPMEAVKAYQLASEGENSPHRSVVYPNAEHGFLSPFGSRHDEEAAQDAWKQTIEHFDKYLKA